MPLRFVWGVRAIDGGRHLDPGNKGGLQLDPTFNIATTKSQQWMLSFCKDVQKQPFYRTLAIGQLSLSNCFMETFKDWMDRRCFDELAMKDHGKCCKVTKFPYPEPIFNQCLMEAISDLYATPTDFWRPGAAGPKFNITTNRVEAMVVEFDSNITFSFSHTAMDSFYQDVEMWFSKVIATAPPEMRCGFFISHLGFYDVQNSLTWDTIVAIGIALSATFTVLVLATRNLSLTISAAITVCSTIFVTVGVLILLFDWKLNILESVAITLSIGLSVDFSLHYAITYTNGSSRNGSNVEKSVIYAVVNMAAPVSMAALTTFLAGICLLPTRVLAYIQIGTFIVILMSTSWIFSTFFFHALLRIIGRGQKCESLDQKQESLVFQGMDDDNIINSSANTNIKPIDETLENGNEYRSKDNDAPILSNIMEISDSKEKLYAVSESTITHAVSIANRNGNHKQLCNELRKELHQKVDKMAPKVPKIDYSKTIMITQEMLSNGRQTNSHDNRIMPSVCEPEITILQSRVTESLQSLNKPYKRVYQDFENLNLQKISVLDEDEHKIDSVDIQPYNNIGSAPKILTAIYNRTDSRISPTFIMQKDNINVNSSIPSKEQQCLYQDIQRPVSSFSSDALDSSITSRNLETRYVHWLAML